MVAVAPKIFHQPEVSPLCRKETIVFKQEIVSYVDESDEVVYTVQVVAKRFFNEETVNMYWFVYKEADTRKPWKVCVPDPAKGIQQPPWDIDQWENHPAVLYLKQHGYTKAPEELIEAVHSADASTHSRSATLFQAVNYIQQKKKAALLKQQQEAMKSQKAFSIRGVRPLRHAQAKRRLAFDKQQKKQQQLIQDRYGDRVLIEELVDAAQPRTIHFIHPPRTAFV